MAVPSLTRRRIIAGQPVLSPADLCPSEGEIYYLWSYIQGSIMIPETRRQLRRAWGMCERHAFVAVAVECAHRRTFLHGPAILYRDLMERAVAAFDGGGPLKGIQIARRLQETQSCLMCDLGYDAHKGSIMTLPDYIQAGKNLTNIRAFAVETEPYWRGAICGQCAGNGARPLCRLHLRERLGNGGVALDEQRELVESIFERIDHYHRSFWWEHRGTDTVEDRAALISAIGWCSGWRPWLMLREIRDCNPFDNLSVE
jgi:hypothetical protein